MTARAGLVACVAVVLVGAGFAVADQVRFFADTDAATHRLAWTASEEARLARAIHDWHEPITWLRRTIPESAVVWFYSSRRVPERDVQGLMQTIQLLLLPRYVVFAPTPVERERSATRSGGAPVYVVDCHPSFWVEDADPRLRSQVLPDWRVVSELADFTLYRVGPG